MYIYIYVYIYIYINTYIHLQIHVHIHVGMHMDTNMLKIKLQKVYCNESNQSKRKLICASPHSLIQFQHFY
ncbi:hypothetical protein KP509_36G037200 [Ceratopteris richardii]|nr:hypothetical protein KP509_36G037200 [Ceratopteris richardii]